MPKKLFALLIPSPIKISIEKKKAKEMLYDFPSIIYRAVDERLFLDINFPKSDDMLGRSYWIIHMLEKKDRDGFYAFMRTEVYSFLIVLHHRLEDHIKGKNPHPWTNSYLERVNQALEKVRFIIKTDDNILPDPELGFIECDHCYHS